MNAQAYAQPSNSGSSSSFGLLNLMFVILGLFTIYYLYTFLYPSIITNATTLIGGQQAANVAPTKPPTGPTPFEGGEYSVNTWVYINSFNTNLNTPKHVFEIQGENFSTLLIALGAMNNTLIVRTHNENVVSGFASGGDSTSTGGNGTSTGGNGTSTGSPGSPGSLSAADVDAIFTYGYTTDSPPPICDLPQIDLQRWTMITVVLSGRTIDVYLDGKLSRSCTTASYYRVDPTGVTMNIVDRGGFDGYIGNTTASASTMNPDEIYRAYLGGPQASSMNVVTWFLSLFKGTQAT